jgi:hypothetical protein
LSDISIEIYVFCLTFVRLETGENGAADCPEDTELVLSNKVLYLLFCFALFDQLTKRADIEAR